MQMEQNFRDIKNQELGLGLRQNRSQTLDRIKMLWFLAYLIIIISWWFGLMIETTNQHWRYQGNTLKNKRVKSVEKLCYNLNYGYEGIYSEGIR